MSESIHRAIAYPSDMDYLISERIPCPMLCGVREVTSHPGPDDDPCVECLTVERFLKDTLFPLVPPQVRQGILTLLAAGRVTR